MPYKIGHPCAAPFCPGIVPSGIRFCPKHKAMEKRIDNRPSAAARGYDGKWQKFRPWYLRRHPLCEEEGCGHLGSVIHHILPLSAGGDKYLEENLRVLCRFHHNQLTAKLDGGFGNIKKEREGHEG